MLHIIMGPAGCGKSTFGRAFADYLGVRFFDADDYHSEQNKGKLQEGIPLTDEDRWPWLDRLHDELPAKGVLACSALKEAYRLVLAKDRNVRFIYLKVPVAVLEKRLQERHHFLNPVLLQDQLAILEEPHDALVLDGTLPIDLLITLPQSF